MVEFGVPFQPPRQELSDSATLLVTALDLSHISWRTTGRGSVGGSHGHWRRVLRRGDARHAGPL